MFTDQPVTPLRLESLINLLRNNSQRRFRKEQLYELLQPTGLPDLKDRVQSRVTLAAAEELALVETVDGIVRLTFDRKDKRSTGRIVCDAWDVRVLADRSVEPYFALFYSYLLGLDRDVPVRQSPDDWAIRFERDVFRGERPNNPVNITKVTGIRRWLQYVGLGWYDPAGEFQPNPYSRLLRRLDLIFGSEKRLADEQFMTRLGEECPELDGGAIFQLANGTRRTGEKTCTLGLAHALVDLHESGHLRLHCEPDSRGWSLDAAEPPPDGKTLRSGRIDFVEYLQP